MEVGTSDLRLPQVAGITTREERRRASGQWLLASAPLVSEAPSKVGAGSLATKVARNLPGEPTAAGSARRLVEAVFGAWGFSAADAAVVVSELVTNAVEHAGRKPVRVTLALLGGGRVRISVVDLSRQLPQPRGAGAEDESGRGLALVGLMSSGWGVDHLRWGKRVWAELKVETAAGS